MMTKTHELKTDPAVFQALSIGAKTFEIRKDDRGFEVGDTLILRETVSPGHLMAHGAKLEYTGRQEQRKVTHILRGPTYGLTEGWVIMSVDSPRIAELERDALAAHVELLERSVSEFAAYAGVPGVLHADTKRAYEVLNSEPITSLTRRDAAQRGKALAETAKWFAALHTSTELLSAEVVHDILMDQSRRQTEAQQ
ncbi:ASCH/PUA domain-containing protein [Vreelandella stevensii]|uniref:ASCH/PUA domain-containing protein n=1 Tax=Vreelandella stevensii TaxID=502821 RepID=UPI00403B179C